MFWDVLRSMSPSVGPDSNWEQIRERIRDTQLSEMVPDEAQRQQFFESFIKSLQEACGHYHSTNPGSKKKKKEKKRKHEVRVEIF